MLKNRNRKTNENGITMTALVITIIMIIIISVPLIVQINNPNKLNALDKLKRDLVNLKESVSIAYEISINFDTYDVNAYNYIGPKAPSSLVEKLKDKTQESVQVINPNDTENNYYIIDFDKLKSVLSSKYNMDFDKPYYGKENSNLSGKSKSDLESITDDVYIINNKSRTIYYVKGIEYEGETYYRYQENYTEIDETLPGSILLRKNAPMIYVDGLNYADFDGDKVADGIIVADLAADCTDTTVYKKGNPWGNSYGSFSYVKQTTGLNEYSSEDYTYTTQYTNGERKETKTVTGTLITCTKNAGKPRYYVLSLGDYDFDTYNNSVNKRHSWYYSASVSKKLDNYHDGTYNDFGEGKIFTDYNIKKWNSSAYGAQNGDSTDLDLWGVIQDKVKEGWFVPSRAEWAAFASYLGLNSSVTNPNYSKYGLTWWYWSSAQQGNNSVYTIRSGIMTRLRCNRRYYLSSSSYDFLKQ